VNSTTSHPERHLDPDELADVLAGEASADAEEHVAGCDRCRTDLADLEAASTQVTADLAALPALGLPADVARRLHAALDDAADGPSDVPVEPTPGAATVTPFPAADGNPRAARWLAAAAAVVVLLAGGMYAFTQLRGDRTSPSADTAAGAAKAGSELALARNSSGTDYTDRASLSAALPDLLSGRRQAAGSALAQGAPAPTVAGPQRGANTLAVPAADPLAPLRDNKGLADCLVALLPPDDPSVQPLAIDYASFRGRPAMVVVIPGSVANKLDVFVVGPTCSQANDSVLFYTSVDRP
jgi:hypothetical protein